VKPIRSIGNLQRSIVDMLSPSGFMRLLGVHLGIYGHHDLPSHE
jgi:hypothetical protein